MFGITTVILFMLQNRATNSSCKYFFRPLESFHNVVFSIIQQACGQILVQHFYFNVLDSALLCMSQKNTHIKTAMWLRAVAEGPPPTVPCSVWRGSTNLRTLAPPAGWCWRPVLGSELIVRNITVINKPLNHAPIKSLFKMYILYLTPISQFYQWNIRSSTLQSCFHWNVMIQWSLDVVLDIPHTSASPKQTASVELCVPS